jgi:hypothetical protein
MPLDELLEEPLEEPLDSEDEPPDPDEDGLDSEAGALDLPLLPLEPLEPQPVARMLISSTALMSIAASSLDLDVTALDGMGSSLRALIVPRLLTPSGGVSFPDGTLRMAHYA